jgi:hypothetical protein
MADVDSSGALAYVYVPIGPAGPPDAHGRREISIELRLGADGGPILPVFTSRAALAEQLGPHQRFARMPVLQLFVQMSPKALPVVVDPVVDPAAERWNEAGFAAPAPTAAGEQ